MPWFTMFSVFMEFLPTLFLTEVHSLRLKSGNPFVPPWELL